MRFTLPVLLLSLIMPQAATAHVVFNEAQVKPGELATFGLRVTHGCSGTPTTEIRVHLPEGITRVTPRALSGWDVSVVKRPLPAPVTLHGQTLTETVASLIWRGGAVPDFAFEQFEFRALVPQTPGATLYFPVEQICADGRHDWKAIPATPAEWGALKEPAPFVTIAQEPVAKAKGHHH